MSAYTNSRKIVRRAFAFAATPTAVTHLGEAVALGLVEGLQKARGWVHAMHCVALVAIHALPFRLLPLLQNCIR